MIMAPNAEVVVGQSGKNFYGAIYAKAIVVHQNANFAWGGAAAGKNYHCKGISSIFGLCHGFLKR